MGRVEETPDSSEVAQAKDRRFRPSLKDHGDDDGVAMQSHAGVLPGRNAAVQSDIGPGITDETLQVEAAAGAIAKERYPCRPEVEVVAQYRGTLAPGALRDVDRKSVV